jgi:integration host factor subunit beta
MTKSELINILSKESINLPARDVELAIKCVLEQMSQALEINKRIEIRGFGSFSLHFRPPRVGRNPKTGESVELEGKYVPHFKPGKDLRERVNKKFNQIEDSPSEIETISGADDTLNELTPAMKQAKRAHMRNRARARARRNRVD